MTRLNTLHFHAIDNSIKFKIPKKKIYIIHLSVILQTAPCRMLGDI